MSDSDADATDSASTERTLCTQVEPGRLLLLARRHSGPIRLLSPTSRVPLAAHAASEASGPP